jgi:hypothetical protein
MAQQVRRADMHRVTLESALRLLIHARNSHGSLRARIRQTIRQDIALLRLLHTTNH